MGLGTGPGVPRGTRSGRSEGSGEGGVTTSFTEGFFWDKETWTVRRTIESDPGRYEERRNTSRPEKTFEPPLRDSLRSVDPSSETPIRGPQT